jgi:hypothetical protein
MFVFHRSVPTTPTTGSILDHTFMPPFMVPTMLLHFEERRRFGCLEGVGSALGDDVPFAPFPCILADLPGRHAIVRKRLKDLHKDSRGCPKAPGSVQSIPDWPQQTTLMIF